MSLRSPWSGHWTVFRLARSRGLYNTFVTNGYMTPESLLLLIDAGLDAMNVDIKGDAEVGRKYCKTIDVEKVWSACQLARSRDVHIEVTTLIIPGVNDSEATLLPAAATLLVFLPRPERTRVVPLDLGSVAPRFTPGGTGNRYYPCFTTSGAAALAVGN